MTKDLHVVEQGDAWEVRREGDSQPLGSYVTRGEAVDRAQAEARVEGVRVTDHTLDDEMIRDVTPSADPDR